MLNVPYARIGEQMELAAEAFPDALAIGPVWKSDSRTLDVGALVWLRDERTGGRRGQVVSLARRAGVAVVL